MRPWPRPHLALRNKIRRLDEIEGRFLGLLRRPVNALIVALAQQVGEKTPIDTVILPARVRSLLAERLRDMMLAARQVGVLDGQRDIFRARARVNSGALFARLAQGDPGEPSPESIPTEGLEWYETHALTLADVVEQDILAWAKDVIIASRIEGLSIDDTVDQLLEVLPPRGWARLENIARTETAKIYEQGKYIVYATTPGVVAYEIHAVIDSRTTDICAARNGRVLPITAAANEWPPYHYQCRTTVAAVLDVQIEDGEVAYNPLPPEAPPPLPGFGAVMVPA